MFGNMKKYLTEQLQDIRNKGLYKSERIITSPQRRMGRRAIATGILNLSANNYLGLADHPQVIRAAHEALDRWGYGMASVRFICGTQQIHKELESKISGFLGTDDTILYSSCFDANGGLFETLFGPEDAVISDELNHASIIDGIRLCKAERFRYKNNDMRDLETQLHQAATARFRMIATDGVFSMDGVVANLPGICELADKYDALVMIDDSHGVGVLGPRGRGTHEYHGVMDRVDIITGTLGKALGGASGGYTSGRKEIIEMLRQRSRPYLFSNTVPPPIIGAALKTIDLLMESTELATGWRQTPNIPPRHGRSRLSDHPRHPSHLPDHARRGRAGRRMADAMLKRGVYVIGFSFPVVPQGKRGYPGANLGRPHAGRSTICHGCVCGDKSGIGDIRKGSGVRGQAEC